MPTTFWFFYFTVPDCLLFFFFFFPRAPRATRGGVDENDTSNKTVGKVALQRDLCQIRRLQRLEGRGGGLLNTKKTKTTHPGGILMAAPEKYGSATQFAGGMSGFSLVSQRDWPESGMYLIPAAADSTEADSIKSVSRFLTRIGA